jgi:serine O-acetyltransferase
VIQPGVHIPHGQVVVNGGVSIARGVVLSPFTTLGLVSRAFGGPTIETMAAIGTGAKVLGPVTVGARAKVGANSVVLSDVPPGATVVGAPARVVASG